jgi:hypothetical protein
MSYAFPGSLNIDPAFSFGSGTPNLGVTGTNFGNVAGQGSQLAGSLMPSLTGGGGGAQSGGLQPWAQGLQAAGGLAATFGGPIGAGVGLLANLGAGLFGQQNREQARREGMAQSIGANIFNRGFSDLADFNTEQRKIALAGSPAARRVYGRDLRSDIATRYADPFTAAFARRGSGATF